MGDIIDASERFNAARHALLYAAFTSEQMSQAQLIAHMIADAAFRAYAARRLAEVRQQQVSADEDSA